MANEQMLKFYVDDLSHLARLLREAKEAHTTWERQFEGNVPKHDWEVWYAQWMLQREGWNNAGVEPLDMVKLHTLVGPLA